MSGTLINKAELSFLIKISLIIISIIQTTTYYYFILFYSPFFITDIQNLHLKYGRNRGEFFSAVKILIKFIIFCTTFSLLLDEMDICATIALNCNHTWHFLDPQMMSCYWIDNCLYVNYQLDCCHNHDDDPDDVDDFCEGDLSDADYYHANNKDHGSYYYNADYVRHHFYHVYIR